MRYSLRQLEVFVTVARTESVTLAGDELGLSQSAASGALAELEHQFSVRLFDRIGRRVRLSELGHALRPHAEAVLAQAQELEALLAGKRPIGKLRVGATLTIGNFVAVPLMARYLEMDPEAVVTLDIANTEEVARRVANFEIDIGLIEGELSHPELQVTPFCDDELVVFSASTHALARKRTLSDADLVAASWVVRESGSGTRQTFDRGMYGLVSKLRIAHEMRHLAVIKRAVEAGLGLGCVSRLALADEVARGSLKTYRVPHRDFRRSFFTVLHREKHRTAALDRWIALCVDYGRHGRA